METYIRRTNCTQISRLFQAKNWNWPNTIPDVHSVDLGRAGGGREHAGEDGDRGGLAGAVVAQEGGDVALVEVQGQPVHGGPPAARVYLGWGREKTFIKL